ncbi:MAG: hypothetical protein Q8M34_05860 [Thermodesulfovibrionales bacterium]|nr:hypothetical protein [Thermodesulfovibrionales bacterium]
MIIAMTSRTDFRLLRYFPIPKAFGITESRHVGTDAAQPNPALLMAVR